MLKAKQIRNGLRVRIVIAPRKIEYGRIEDIDADNPQYFKDCCRSAIYWVRLVNGPRVAVPYQRMRKARWWQGRFRTPH